MKQTRERRTYDQQCGLAYALDVVGERWTLLIVRELLLRQRRYGELLEALPGIGTNLLADRLGFLIDAGLVRSLDPDRRTSGYELTELGQRLREPILSLARFGLSYSAHRPAPAGGVTRPSWAVLAVEAMIDEVPADVPDETYEFDVDGELFHVAVVGGSVSVVPTAAVDPALRVSTDSTTFFALGLGRLDPLEAVVSQAVRVVGPAAAVPRCLRLINLTGRLTGALPAPR
ncbi:MULTISPECIES: winged helix-turn-helix transcriptional regulator [Micromonospora]|uniref:Transcriptional regulator, HxlR family n=1 Tax=Micromonospora yangpuensis TaxID=683228 RepID=A0A1C6UU66_9ACTN|nr:helix-turn-helix domain-containing protein [Micromonospora yangpuensis]GGM24415.1 transcriptional regulator [Micromonospora yangpuensis]SCL57541.1 transcriptional regulator, HxlR family [Micromonospora yangpuensis]